MSTKAKWVNGVLTFYDGLTFENLKPLAPVLFEDDFLGFKLNKFVTDAATTTKWGTVETNLNTGILLVASEVNGVVAIIVDSDDNAEVGALHFGDQLPFSLLQGLIFEARLCFHLLPVSGVAETVQAVFGLASAHNTTLDSIGTNAWFRVESAANTALLWEADNPGGTDDDDNAAGIVLANDAYHIYRIDATNIAAVKFYVDNVLVGTADMSTSMSTADALVQPYFNISKAHSAANVGYGTMYIDYMKVWQKRS